MLRRIWLVMLFLMTLLFSLPVYADRETAESPVIGSWMLDRVYENASSEDRLILEPDNAASVYAEKENIYALMADGSAELTMEGVTTFGYWEKTDDRVLMVINSTHRPSDENEADIVPPDEMEFFYDEEQNTLHRYWTDDTADAAYHDLDFVYELE